MDSVRVTDGPTSGTRRMVTLAAEVALSLASGERRIEEAAARRALGEVGLMEAARVRAVQAFLEIGKTIAVRIGRGIVLADTEAEQGLTDVLEPVAVEVAANPDRERQRGRVVRLRSGSSTAVPTDADAEVSPRAVARRRSVTGTLALTARSPS